MIAVAQEIKRKQDVEILMLKLPNGGFTDDQFFEFCQLNENLKIERYSHGEIIIMALTGTKSGVRNSELNAEIVVWNRRKKGGVVADSSSGFKLPNGATYSPDVAWVKNERWNALTEAQQEKFAPLCPDFVVELRSASQTLEHQKFKMQEFMGNGCRLGWLVDPFERMTHVYRPKVEIEEVPFDQPLFGGQVLEGLQVTLSDIM